VHGRRTWQFAENVVDCGFVSVATGEAAVVGLAGGVDVGVAGGVDVGATVGLFAGLTGVIVVGTVLRGVGDGVAADVTGATGVGVVGTVSIGGGAVVVAGEDVGVTVVVGGVAIDPDNATA
jgi:hypothetical protein